MTKTVESQEKGRKAVVSLRGMLISGGVVELAFLVAGLALTFLGFVAVNSLVRDITKNEYERVVHTGVRTVADNFSGFEKTFENITLLFFLSTPSGQGDVVQKLGESGFAPGGFDQIVYAQQNEKGGWSFRIVPLHTEGRFALNMDKGILGNLVQQKNFPDSKTRVLTNPNFFIEGKSDAQPGISEKPFALVKPLMAGEAIRGFVIGVSHPGLVLGKGWHEANDRISRISIRDSARGHDLYRAGAGNAGDDMRLPDEAYEYDFGGSKWEIRAEYGQIDKVSFLNKAPFFAGAVGLVLTLLGAFYIRNYRGQSSRLGQMNLILEQKNSELKASAVRREELNEVLKKSEKEHRAIINSVSDVIFEIDANGKILFLNRTWQKITGFDLEQSRGLELFKMLHPQDQEKQFKDFRALIAGQKQAYRAFTRVRTVDGTFRAVELAFSMMRQDESGASRIAGTLTDIEERRRAERALGEAEKKYRTIVENAAGGIFQLTPEGLYLSVNPAMARILGYEGPDDLLQKVKNANETVYADSRERLAFLRDLEGRGFVSNFEIEVCTASGEKIWVNENVRLVRDDAGNSLYYEGSMEDISQRKRAELALREAKIRSDLANRAKSEFLANMSHELRTPLNAIIGFSEIIKNEVFGPLGQEPYKEYARDIYESGKRLLSVINEILDISKIEAGERRLNEDIVDMGAVVAGCLKLVENKAEANRIVVSNQLENVPNIIGEELAVKQIVVNLLSNAVKFTPHGGRITISSTLDRNGSLRLSITDTGVGLDAHEIEKALSPFGQVDNALSRAGAGTGLGLTLVNALIHLHDGQLELLSKKGLGTTATVVFPADRVVMKKQKTSVTNGKEKV